MTATLESLTNQVVQQNSAIMEVQQKWEAASQTVNAQAVRISQLEAALSSGSGHQSGGGGSRNDIDHKIRTPDVFKDAGSWRSFSDEIVRYVKGINKELADLMEKCVDSEAPSKYSVMDNIDGHSIT